MDDLPTQAMKLEINGEREVDNPTKETLRVAVESLDPGTSGSGFVILSSDKMTYIQSSGDVRNGFDLEYQEGSKKQHFRATGGFTADQIVDILWDYASGGSEWRKAAQRGGETASTGTSPGRPPSIKERMIAREALLPTRFQLVVVAAFVVTISTIGWETRKGSRSHPVHVGPEVPIMFMGCIALFGSWTAYDILKTGRIGRRQPSIICRDTNPILFWVVFTFIFIFVAAAFAFVAVTSHGLWQ
jgi:hypothetical protein